MSSEQQYLSPDSGPSTKHAVGYVTPTQLGSYEEEINAWRKMVENERMNEFEAIQKHPCPFVRAEIDSMDWRAPWWPNRTVIFHLPRDNLNSKPSLAPDSDSGFEKCNP